MKYLKWIALGVACGALAVVVSRLEGAFYRELQERSTQVRGEVVGWARDQVERRVGPAWEQGSSFDEIGFDYCQPDLRRTMVALCAWVRQSPAGHAASDDEVERILKQETPYYVIWEAMRLLGQLEMHAERQVRGLDFSKHRQRFDELDAEIQELIRI